MWFPKKWIFIWGCGGLDRRKMFCFVAQWLWFLLVYPKPKPANPKDGPQLALAKMNGGPLVGLFLRVPQRFPLTDQRVSGWHPPPLLCCMGWELAKKLVLTQNPRRGGSKFFRAIFPTRGERWFCIIFCAWEWMYELLHPLGVDIYLEKKDIIFRTKCRF